VNETCTAFAVPLSSLDRDVVGRDDLAAAQAFDLWGRKRGRKMKGKLVFLVLVAAAVVVSAIFATSASADYGKGALYQIELSVNTPGRDGGGVWLWIALHPDFTGDYAGSDCGHGGAGAASDKGDVTWHYSGDSVVIDGVALNALPVAVFPVFIPPPYMPTITVPRAYGHYTGDDHAFMTFPSFIPVGGFSQLQVAGGAPGTSP
jgi:hypothetical protein